MAISDEDIIEEAKSGRASCRTCKNKIDKGTLRFGEAYESQFGDGVSHGWYHLVCAAAKSPFRLEGQLASYDGTVPDKADIDKALVEAKKKIKPPFPYAERAPSGRSKCMQCDEKIEKGDLRVAVEREVETGSFTAKSAGYLHPDCSLEYADDDDFADQVREHSAAKLSEEDIDELEGAFG